MTKDNKKRMAEEEAAAARTKRNKNSSKKNKIYQTICDNCGIIFEVSYPIQPDLWRDCPSCIQREINEKNKTRRINTENKTKGITELRC
jgi:uncharacterized OB-fold protein